MYIESNQRADLYAILDREEHETARPNSDRRKLQWLRFQRINLYFFGWLVVPIVVGLGWAILELLKGGDFSHVLKVFVWMTVCFSPFTIVPFLLMYSLSCGHIFSTLKREWKVRRLGYGEMFAAPWRAERAKRPVINFLTLAAGLFMCSWGIFFIFVEFFLAKLVPNATWTHPSWWVYLCSVYTIGLGAVYVILHLYRRAEEHLGVVQHLRDSLNTAYEGRTQDGKGSIFIDNEVQDRIAQIERKQIWQDRAISISKFGGHSDIAYVVQKGRSVRDVQYELDSTISLRVQDEIETLARGPTESDTKRGEDSNILWRSVPETSFEFAFSADKAAQRIRVLKLQKVAKQVSSSPEVDES